MTVDRETVLSALASASSEGFCTAKDVAVAMGLKGSSPLIKNIRKELDVLARQGRIETEVNPNVGRRYRYVDEPEGAAGIVARMERRAKAVEDGVVPGEEEGIPEENYGEEEEIPEENYGEDGPEEGSEAEDGRPRLVRRSLPTATHRVLKVLSDGKARTLKELKGFGVSSTTLKPMREEGLVLSEPDGYRITDDGLRGLSEIEEDWPQLRDSVYEYERPRPKGRMPTTVHAMLCALADGRPRRAKDLTAAGIGEKTHGTVYQHGWCERTSDGYSITEAGLARLDEIERDWPELKDRRPEPVQEPEPAPKAESLPEPETVQEAPRQEPVQTPEPEPEKAQEIPEPAKEPGPDEDEEVPEPTCSEPENAIITDVAQVFRLTLRTKDGERTVDVRTHDVLGRFDNIFETIGRAVRLRTDEGRLQVGHILDEKWRDTL